MCATGIMLPAVILTSLCHDLALRRVEEAIEAVGLTGLRPIFDQLNGEVSYDDIRIVVECQTIEYYRRFPNAPFNRPLSAPKPPAPGASGGHKHHHHREPEQLTRAGVGDVVQDPWDQAAASTSSGMFLVLIRLLNTQ